MTALRLRLPDGFPSEGGAVAWACGDRRVPLRSHGLADLASLPASGRAALVVPASRVTLVTAVLPAVARARLHALLPYVVEEVVADDPAALLVVPVDPRPGEPTPLLVMAKAWLDAWVEALATRRIVSDVAVPEWLCLPHEAGAWSLSVTDRDGVLRSGEVLGAALDGADGDAPPAGLVLALEAARRAGELPARLLACRDAAGPDTGLPAWCSRLDPPVVAGPDWDWRTAPLDPRANLLAGRSAGARSRPGWRSMQPGIAAGAAALALHAAACGADWAGRSQERDRLRSEMRALYETAVPGARNVVDPPLQLKRKLAEARRASGEVAPDDFLALVATLVRADLRIAPGAIRGLRYRQGVLELDLVGPGLEAGRAWAATLEDHGLAGARAESVAGGIRLFIASAGP